jgi:hypothetical protein
MTHFYLIQFHRALGALPPQPQYVSAARQKLSLRSAETSLSSLRIELLSGTI